jgi:hypothetical protein
MARYAVNNTLAGTQQNASSSFKTAVLVNAATGATTLRRGWCDEFQWSVDGAPNSTDCTVVHDISRMTADGTETSATPNPLETNDAAALLTYKVNATAEPTVTAASSLDTQGLNQRQNFRWKVFDLAQALVVPATNLAGLVTRFKSATFTSTVVHHLFVVE